VRRNPLVALLRINWSSPAARTVDLSLAVSALGYGVYDGSPLLIWAGLAAIGLSLLNPMGRLQRGLGRVVRLTRRV
jgi:hypothetical protein